ncbi:MAG: succinate dehydrogenase, cytochrome b556 subunit [Alphaproteobacteria bacterium]|jgi:succinate dehydrogenase / fumarate reductase cytochrome b subunit
MPEAPAKGRAAARPLAPHLQIYRWPITMGTSILHRITGVGLTGGTLLLAWWLYAASDGPESYAVFESVAGHWFGQLVLFGFTLALVYHAFNGVRHLFWDAGMGFDLKSANRSGLIVYGATLLTTLVIWIAAYQSMGTWQ